MAQRNSYRKSSIFNTPYKILYVVLPTLLSLIIGTATMGSSDTMQVVRWLLLLLMIGIGFYPLSAFIFRKSSSGGFIFGKTLGILTISLISWTLGYIGILPFNKYTIWIIFIACAVACYAIKPLRETLIVKLNLEFVAESFLIEESVFAIALTILCYFKGFLPDINGQEKFMDYGFVMSMLRSSSLPANDMWLSGYSINYYYFGQFIYALITKMSGIAPSIAYNIAMCCSIALPFALCYGIGSYLIDTAKYFGLKTIRFTNVICGILCGFTTMIFGNSHSFYYDENSIGNSFLKLFSKLGINVGTTDHFFYPQSTRFIGYNPDSATIEGIKNGADYTIEEFPFYSFLVGDLHAHVCSTIVVLTIIAVSIALIGRVADQSIGEKKLIRLPIIGALPNNLPEGFTIKSEFLHRLKTQWKNIINIEIIVVAILLGIAQMTNYWDFLIYFIFASMVLLIVMTRTSNDFCTYPGAFVFLISIFDILALYLCVADIPLLHVALQLFVLCLVYITSCYAPCALSRTALGMSFLFTVSNLVALSFNMSFDMISNTIALCQNHSSLFQLWILYGTHVFICIAFIAFTIVYKNYAINRGNKKLVNNGVIGISSSDRLNPVSKFFGERNIVDVFVCGMIVVGILLIIAPEIFYVRDIYTFGYLRSNTMFKFTYAAFIILSLCMAYAIVRLFWLVSPKGEFSALGFATGIFFCFLLIAPAHYTGVSLTQRSGEIKKENYRYLNGTIYMQSYSSPYCLIRESGNISPYYDAISWFNQNVSGSPTIAEAYGESYTDYSIVSAYTGLPTVCGWQTHEQLWRFHGIVDPSTNLLVSDPTQDVWELYINPRHEDISTLYTDENPEVLQEIINKYEISYVVLGPLELNRFGVDNSLTISKLGSLVFESKDLKIYKVNPYTPG